MTWKKDAQQGNEARKIKWELVPYTRGTVLDIGCGPYKAFPHFVGFDSCIDTQLFGIPMLPDIKGECTDLSRFASQSHDAVFSSHCLEHIEDHKKALREWWRVIKPGGHLCLYLPHKDFYPNIGVEGANPDHKHDFTPQDIIDVMMGMKEGWDLIENQDRNEDDEYSFFQVYRKTNGDKKRFSYKEPITDKPMAAVIRYGAFGDLLQASSVLAGLKQQGYHVTLYSSPPGVDVVKSDPNIDRIILQDKDQVPNLELGDFWKYVSKKYAKFVNLSESVEGSWLALPGRTNHYWPLKVRQKMMDVNYLEFQHLLADVPHRPQMKFYATEDERVWARKERSKMGRKVVLWALAGSAVHKSWPHMDIVIARIMLKHPDVTVVLTGGPDAAMLEGGWDNEKRVVKTCGKWSIRQTLAFLAEADLVIGPETGVLNAASQMPMPKIVFLSHSSVENLTRDWENTVSLTSKKTDCYPCHKLIYGFHDCKEGFVEINGKQERVGAHCQVAIGPDEVWDHMNRLLSEDMQMAA